MACQIFKWLLASEGPSTLQHGLVGIGCLLTYDLFGRWRKRRRLQASDAGADTAQQVLSYPEREEQQRRRAA
jgi:hypothetical protein